MKDKSKKNTSGRGGPPNPVDIHVGTRIRLQRRLLGMTQQDFATALGLTFQQVQKYERGLNRIAASRLYDMARILGVDLAFFFEDMQEDVSDKSPSRMAGIRDAQASEFKPDPMQRRETLELVRNYYRIKDNSMRKIIFDLCERMSKEIIGRKPHDEGSVA